MSGYLHARGLISTDRADRWVRFLKDPGSRSYAICYPAGLALCRDFAGNEPTRFKTLLTEQVRVRDLLEATL